MEKRAFVKTMMSTLTCVILSTSVTTACSDDDTPAKKPLHQAPTKPQ